LSEIPNEKIEEAPSPNNDMTAIKQDLEQAINILPPKQKMVFILHDVQGFTHMEIAKIMKLRQGTCKSQLFKARMKLKEYLME
jgi:RNA polymerase sigma-70 factor (ECF subfamily)